MCSLGKVAPVGPSKYELMHTEATVYSRDIHHNYDQLPTSFLQPLNWCLSDEDDTWCIRINTGKRVSHMTGNTHII